MPRCVTCRYLLTVAPTRFCLRHLPLTQDAAPDCRDYTPWRPLMTQDPDLDRRRAAQAASLVATVKKINPPPHDRHREVARLDR